MFSKWPSELGLVSLRDPELMEKCGTEIAKEWRAGGVHKLYGYMADLASEPRWSGFNGSFGEDLQLIVDFPRDVPGKFLDDSYAYVDSSGAAYKYGHGLSF
ncbi:glycoside hydrolase family 3 N-terminal domain-containing protein [Corynebacterium deserti]|uniref:glycoside hydrolase family 3 N-terminal domain-containing protein n=1 Tax=Corynebacterium deserti TaxID=1408191 RepID=UPI000A403DD0|nr:glycoside hydrolase family 3 N-terminal domain-containing protein [Corynebacterium deserti]